jgi:hypothetical protein
VLLRSLAAPGLAQRLLCSPDVQEKRLEQLLGWRVMVVWGLLMCSFLHGDPIEPVCAWLVLAGLLYGAAKWSATVARESAAALLLLDAPVLFTLREQLPVPPSLLLPFVLIAGMVTLSRRLAALLVIELIVIQTQLPGGLTGVEAAVAQGVLIIALGVWIVWRSTQPRAP